MGVLEKAGEHISLPGEAVGTCRVLMAGDGYVRIENHRGLLEYSAEYLTAGRRGGTVRVRGEGLCIAAMDKEDIVIKGKIYGVDME